ncbi:MAG: terpene cyclase/mutase family protein [Desulfobacteraceae bacterium]|nr:terpene cyclase/mutase family protein [Desulfobacteraceae bacterium]
MKQMIRTAAAVCLTLLFLTAAAGAKQAQEKKSTPVDFQKITAHYLQWTTRPSFPESVPFAYYPVYAMRALGKKLPGKTRTTIVKFLKSCQKPDGGFVNEPKNAPASNLIYTYYALQALDLLGQQGAIDRGKALGYVLSLQDPKGGFKLSTDAKEKASLAGTFYGVRSLALLRKLDAVDKQKTAAFIASCKEKGKGYSLNPGKFSSPQATFMAVHTLDLLGLMTGEISRDVKNYLHDTRYAGHVTDKYYSLPSMQDMSYVLRTLRELKAMEVADLSKAADFVNSLYIDENGGFGPEPGYGTTPPSTYYAIVCLVQLGKFPDPLK